MRARCRLASRHNHSRYAKVGYDQSWDSFDRFLADMGERPAGKTLDRKDGSRGYSADNCRWATPREQSRNRVGGTNKITFDQAVEIIRMRLVDGATCRVIAEKFGTSENLPREIVKGRCWIDAMEKFRAALSPPTTSAEKE